MPLPEISRPLNAAMKRAIMNNLQAQKVWREASELKDQIRLKLVGAGMKGTEACEDGWWQMLEEYPLVENPQPPPEKEKSAKPEPGVDEAWSHEPEDDPDFLVAARWVSQTIGNPSVRLENIKPPAAAAKAALYKAYRHSPKEWRELFKMILPKLLPKENDTEQLRAFFDDGGVISRLDRLLVSSEKLAAEARANRTVECHKCGSRVAWPK